MKSAPLGPRRRDVDLSDPKAAYDALLHWDELDAATLAALESNPALRQRLEVLRRTDGWLRAQSSAGSTGTYSNGVCPSAEDLYEFGNGVGTQDASSGAPATRLTSAQRDAIERHLIGCAQCERFVGTLASVPPSPLILGLADADAGPVMLRSLPVESDARSDAAAKLDPEPSLRIVGESPRPVARRARPWVFAAAAAVLVAAGATFLMTTRSLPGFPESPLLRGESDAALLFPRDRVLALSEPLRAAWPAWAANRGFEVAPVTEAGTYGVELGRHDGGAFSNSEAVRELHSATPMQMDPLDLAPGTYTWKAWASVRGLDQPLGSRDFEIVVDEAMERELLALSTNDLSAHTLKAIRLLHERGYLTDARALSRILPQSPQRDAYLARHQR